MPAHITPTFIYYIIHLNFTAMTFTVQPSDLKSAAAAIKSAAASKNAMPILDYVLFRPLAAPVPEASASGSTAVVNGATAFSLVCCNGESQVTVTLPVSDPSDSLTPFLLSIADLTQYVANAMGQWPIDVTVTPSTRNNPGTITFADELGETTFTTSPDVTEFPVMPAVAVRTADDGTTIGGTITLSSDLLPYLAIASNYKGTDLTLRPQICGVYIDIKDQSITLVASDMKRMCRYTIPTTDYPSPCNIILPIPALAAIGSISNGAEPLVITWDDKRLAISQSGREFQTPRIEGRYPRYEAVIPKNNNIVVAVPRTLLASAVKRVCSVAPTSVKQVNITAKSDGTLTLQSADWDLGKSATVNLRTSSVSGLTGSITIGVRGNFLLSALDNQSSRDVLICLSDPSRPVLLREEQDSPSLILLLPLTIQ